MKQDLFKMIDISEYSDEIKEIAHSQVGNSQGPYETLENEYKDLIEWASEFIETEDYKEELK